MVLPKNYIMSKHIKIRSSFNKNQTLPITNLVDPTVQSTVDETPSAAGATQVSTDTEDLTVVLTVDETSSATGETPIIMIDR